MNSPRTGRPFGPQCARQWLLVLLLPISAIACVDYGIDDDNYVCRTQDECAAGMKCGAGASCVCQCLKPEQIPNANCADPDCLNPQILQ